MINFSQTSRAKLLWFGIVCVGFFGAGYLISKSYFAWQESPIATSITTHPIDNLDFPIVTICPPKDSNTALYPDLVKAGNRTLSYEVLKILKGAAYEIFMGGTHRRYAQKMSTMPSAFMGNIYQVYRGFNSLPKPISINNNPNISEIKMWNLNGTITSPWYGKGFVEDFFKEDREYHVLLELPIDIRNQIGSGSLMIDIEVDIRKEKGWNEEVNIFTLYDQPKGWVEAEAECQKEGGYLVSVLSLEENERIGRVAQSMRVDSFWLGGKKELGSWIWSNNATFEFTKWGSGWGNGANGSCVYSNGKHWSHCDCRDTFPFICQTRKANTRQTLSKAYTKSQLTIRSFHLWYKCKAANQRLLDSWKDKRMTGFKLRWRIENPSVIMTTSSNEVGRTIQSPIIGDTTIKSGDDTVDHIYKVALTIPEDLQHEVRDENLVVKLMLNMTNDYEMELSTSYKLYNYEIWARARTHCKKEGGRLATINSEQKQILAEKAAGGEEVWIGGRREKNSYWTWSDNSTWSFTNWEGGRGEKDDRCLRMAGTGKWRDDVCSTRNSDFLCEGEVQITREASLTRLVMTKNQLKFLPLMITFKRNATISTEARERKSGFTINWSLESSNGSQLTEKLPARAKDWKKEIPTPKYLEPSLATAVQMAQHLRQENLTNEELLEEVIHKKVDNIDIFENPRTCYLGLVRPAKQTMIFSKLDSQEIIPEDGIPSEDDIRLGFTLFHTLRYCPGVKATKLFRFLNQLITNESARTIIHTVVNLFHSGFKTDEISFILAKEFYSTLAATLNLQYGNILMATHTKSQLQTVLSNDLPYFTNKTGLVENCLQKSRCDGVQEIIQTLGNLPKELVLHPIHLIPDKEGNLPPSALVPFCSYQGNLLGQERPEIDNLAMCDKFKPTILEGQLCYSLEIERLEEKPTKSGKTNGLLLLVDTNNNQENSLVPIKGGHNAEDTKAADQFKVFIHTFGQYTTFGSGSFEMSVLKKLTGTESFEQLPDNKKKCQVHKREECQTAKYLDQVQAECRCVPWSLNSNSPVQVKAGSFIFNFLKVLKFCGPEMEDCVRNQTLRDKSCLAPCTGLYADIADDSLKKRTRTFEQNVIKGMSLL